VVAWGKRCIKTMGARKKKKKKKKKKKRPASAYSLTQCPFVFLPQIMI
jgi:hypothetical protein